MPWDRAGDIEVGLGLARGLTGSQIATLLREKYPHIGATRNSVIGRIHRKGGAELIALAQAEAPERCADIKPVRRVKHGGGRPKGVQGKRAVPSVPTIKKAPTIRPHRGHVSDAPIEALERAQDRFERAWERSEHQAGESRMVPIIDLRAGECRWPHGNGLDGPFLFCGAVQQDPPGGRPYCAEHNRLAYNAGGQSLTPEQKAGLQARAAGRPKRTGISFRILA